MYGQSRSGVDPVIPGDKRQEVVEVFFLRGQDKRFFLKLDLVRIIHVIIITDNLHGSVKHDVREFQLFLFNVHNCILHHECRLISKDGQLCCTGQYMTRHDTTRHLATRHDMTRHDKTHDTTRCDTRRYGTTDGT